MKRTAWTTYDGSMTFTFPDGTRSSALEATRVDHPVTMCKVIDSFTKLSGYERRALVHMLAEHELRSARPREEG